MDTDFMSCLRPLLLSSLFLTACSLTAGGSDDPLPPPDESTTEEAPLLPAPPEPPVIDDDVEDPFTAEDPETGLPPDTPVLAECPLGTPCNPIPVELFPFTDTRDTTQAPQQRFDHYSCAPDAREGGGEWLYAIKVTELGLLTASIDDVSGDDVDIDLHLLSATDPNACLTRHNRALVYMVEPGTYYLAADTYTTETGEARGGPFTLSVGWKPLGSGACAMQARDLKMYWPSCAPGLDCFEGEDFATGKQYRYLRTPATGAVVKEAHLVTEAEAFDTRTGWPKSFTHGLKNHYTLSQAASGFETDRKEPWAPAGEGGSKFGQGSTGGPIPVLDEAWYITMYWRDRPARGTRMIVMNVENGRAVVASAGYETGPGSNQKVAGVVEEVHHHLETTHGSQLLIGFALDQELPLGPIACGEPASP